MMTDDMDYTKDRFEFHLFPTLYMYERADHPERFVRFREFYPSYMRYRTPYIITGEMPIDEPFLFAWLTVLNEPEHADGFVFTNLVNTIPPKHVEVGTPMESATIRTLLPRYRTLRERVKQRIEAFWSAQLDWKELHTAMCESTRELLQQDYVPDQEAKTAAVHAFATRVDAFFDQFLEGETMDQFRTRRFREFDEIERRFAKYDFQQVFLGEEHRILRDMFLKGMLKNLFE
jgi:hypothetical protein